MKYKTTCAISYKGDRVERGAVIEMTEKEAAVYGNDVVAVSDEVVEEDPVVDEKPLEDMTVPELKDKAASLDLSTSGTKASLIERINLHLAGGNEDSEESEEEDPGENE